MSTPNQMPPGRDNIPSNHPRRIANLALDTSDAWKARESEEVCRLVAKHREREKARAAAWKKVNACEANEHSFSV